MLEGGAESRFLTQNQSDFQYVVHSCTAMNVLRAQWGEAAVTCVDQTELDDAVDQIEAFVQVKNLFFDPTYYHDNAEMQPVSSTDFTILNSRFGQVKTKKVYLDDISYLDSYWYNAPFLKGQKFETYTVRSENFEITSLSNEANLAEFGYLNIVLN